MNPPGWYPDPQDSRRVRYWNGASWTDATQPAGAAASTTAPQPTVPGGFEPQASSNTGKVAAIAAGVALGVVALVGAAAFLLTRSSGDSVEAAAGESTTTTTATTTTSTTTTTTTTTTPPPPPVVVLPETTTTLQRPAPRYVPPPTYVYEAPVAYDIPNYCPSDYFPVFYGETARTNVQPFRVSICSGGGGVLYVGRGLDSGDGITLGNVSGWDPWYASNGATSYVVSSYGLDVSGAANFSQGWDVALFSEIGD